MNRMLSIVLVLLLSIAPVAQAASARHAIFVSDLHVGAGRQADGQWTRTEDFRWQDDFNAFLDMAGKRSADQADLILAGDVFELWQSPTMVCSSDLAKPGCVIPNCHDADTDIGCSETEAVARLDAVLDHHADFIAALKAFASRGENRVVFVPGNHDAALTFPAVRAALLKRLAPARVTVAEQGYWVSADGVVYSDHGHQFDDLNQFPRWPTPFVERGGKQYLAKPWGENMVQRFYNQYEAVYPIIDNLADEETGMLYAVNQAGFADVQEALRRFARFFVYEESLRQTATLLGKRSPVQWNYGAVRGNGVAFFLDVLPAARRPPADAVSFAPAALTEREIDAICAAKEKLPTAAKCQRLAGTLGALAKGAVQTDEQRMVGYLRHVLPRVAGVDVHLADVYVFGHTHSAVSPHGVGLGEVGHGMARITVVNTGAFQRVASAAQLDAVLRLPANAGRRPLDLMPEDLPACYNFVWIAPYAARSAVPQLYRWEKGAAGYGSSEGPCIRN